MQLSDAVPIEKIRQRFPNLREDAVATNVAAFLFKRRKDVPPTCLFIWDEMVHRGLVAEPYKIAPVINNEFKKIYEFVERELGRKPMDDAYAVELFLPEVEESFVEISLVQCFPSDIHIADIELSDPTQPIEPTHADAEPRNFKGLHLFNEFLERLREVAKDRRVERISLMVAYPPLYEVFLRHGFRVSETEMAKTAFEAARRGFPMVLHV